ncbi:hypothetical protein ccbrp13_63360 [Ktedonobacteria bacterium brp13]|nr:hypothetical protein ccbrp13_63360 [Ktedonobacteria bacterium brp13]
MIGVTAAASAGIYFSCGDIPPVIAAPVALGILVGSLVGAKVLAHLRNKTIRVTRLHPLNGTSLLLPSPLPVDQGGQR